MILTIQDYAAQCCVSRAVIYKRIAAGKITPDYIKGKRNKVLVIDTDKNPLAENGEGKAGRPKITDQLNKISKAAHEQENTA